MGWFREWRRRRVLKYRAILPEAWFAATASMPVLQGLSAEERERLRALATLFLSEKSLEPVQGLELTKKMALIVAAQAVLPILNLGIDSYDQWHSLVLYPDEFITRREWTDEHGLVHARRDILSGEAWERGPMVLSWADVAEAPVIDGYNPVIHECAHKLDLLNGDANGMPPLHAGMNSRAWREVFEAAYEDLCRRADAGLQTAVDPYATESPAECFAVMSEHFFETPHALRAAYPEVYAQLALFYRQSPVTRIAV